MAAAPGAAVAAALLGLFVAAAWAGPDVGFRESDLRNRDTIIALFDTWSERYGIAIPHHERDRRLGIFTGNLWFVYNHNRSHRRNFTLGLNEFAHLSADEFFATRLGFRPPQQPIVLASNRPLRTFVHDEVNPPDSRDWRTEGAVSPVKNQGQCGSCWAFSTTGAIEGVNKLVTGDLISLSEQELIDCDRHRDDGCEGGLMDFAFQFVINNGGIDTEKDYPYKAVDGDCNTEKRNTHVVSIDDYQDVPSNSEHDLMKAVAAQPVSVAIEADKREFQFYSSGVFDGDCGTDLDHGVLAVGYGTDDSVGMDYWIVKNSWGANWGEQGYIRLKRNVDAREGQCGIAMQASFPIKKGPNPSPSPPKPPAPPPRPVKCDRNHDCPHDTTCCCSVPLGRMCLSWGCCPMPAATCCEDHHHCCPHNFPVCRLDVGMCTKGIGPGPHLGVPLRKKLPARLIHGPPVTKPAGTPSSNVGRKAGPWASTGTSRAAQ